MEKEKKVALNILFVDDTKSRFETFNEVVKSVHTVDYAPGCASAAELLRKNRYDLIMLDYNLIYTSMGGGWDQDPITGQWMQIEEPVAKRTDLHKDDENYGNTLDLAIWMRRKRVGTKVVIHSNSPSGAMELFMLLNNNAEVIEGAYERAYLTPSGDIAWLAVRPLPVVEYFKGEGNSGVRLSKYERYMNKHNKKLAKQIKKEIPLLKGARYSVGSSHFK